MKIVNLCAIAIALFFTISCGGDSKPSTGSGNINGSYSCVEGCNGVCNLPTITVVYEDADLTINFSNYAICQGKVYEGGHLLSNCKRPSDNVVIGDCSGTFYEGGVILGPCNFEGGQCQQISYLQD